MASAIKHGNLTGVDEMDPKPGPARLLVVDDEESVAFTVSEVLRREGYVVDTALSGQEAIVYLQESQYDLLLTDLHMEGIDGISVLAEARRLAPFTISLVLTGFASLESAVAAMRQGAYDYLIKPCNIDDMMLTIRRGLEHRRLVIAEQEARARLEQLNRELERRVEERTAELQRANEELAEANHAKDVFLATLSHELRTPLSPILGWARLLRSGKADSDLLAKGLDAIERNAQLQTQLIDDLLDVSRIVTGKLTIDKEPTDLRAIVKAAVETVRDRAKARAIRLDMELADDPIVVQGSPVRLQQIVWNFLSNAVKFSEGGDHVNVQCYRKGGDACVIVTDTGLGIAPEFLPRVFDPFSQSDGSLTRKHGGLGLGLAIARKLAELHDGRISAESAGVGKGARFTFTMPCVAGAGMERKEEVPLQVANVPQPVLIIDDAADTLEMLEALFAEAGCRVVTAESAKAALELAAAEPPGLIISDIGMPDINGYELLARLRRLPGLEDVPAIAISGFATEEDAARARAAGYAAHMAKPLELDRLFPLIQKLCS
ncbi:MAG TPA: response regulator [Blastocatellia bacterium]|nr:response regulator [Blastocatellia bacterium]